MASLLARPWLVLPLVGIMIICLCGTPRQPGWPPRDWVLVACDVGQGDGIVVRTARDSAVVVDTGPAPAQCEGAWTGLTSPGTAVDHHALSCRSCRRPDGRPAAPSDRSVVGQPTGPAGTAVRPDHPSRPPSAAFRFYAPPRGTSASVGAAGAAGVGPRGPSGFRSG